MKKLILFQFVFLLLISTTFAQHEILWTKTFGGSNSDGAKDIINTLDGGYALAGFTYSYGAGNCDMYLVKTDADGNMEWEKTFGGDGWDFAYALVQTEDAGFLLVGYTTSFGSQDKDIYLVKTDADGNEEWTKRYGGELAETGRDIAKTSDGGFIICGDIETGSAGENDLYIIKIDDAGNEQWNSKYGDELPEWGNSIMQTPDGGYITAGCGYSFDSGNMDFYVIKTDAQGIEEWSEHYSDGPYDWANSIVRSDDGNYFVAGNGDGDDDMMGMRIAKIDATGDKKWIRSVSEGTKHDYCNDMIPITNGVILCGSSKDPNTMENKLYLSQVTNSATIMWKTIYDTPGIANGNAVLGADDGCIIVAGQTSGDGAGSFDVWLVKVNASITTDITDETNTLVKDFQLYQNTPNPFNPSTIIKFTIRNECSVSLKIYNINGELVSTLIDEVKGAGDYSINWNGKDNAGRSVSSGIYFYKLAADNTSLTKKMTLLK